MIYPTAPNQNPPVLPWSEPQQEALNQVLAQFGLKPLGFIPVDEARPVPVPVSGTTTPVKTPQRSLQDEIGRSFGFLQAGHQAIKCALASGHLTGYNQGLSLLCTGLAQYAEALKKAMPAGDGRAAQAQVQQLAASSRIGEIQERGRGLVGGIQGGQYRKY